MVKEQTATSIEQGGALDPQLVMVAVQKDTDLEKSAVMIVGNLHIRTPSDKKSPSITTRQKVVHAALVKMVDHGRCVMHHTVPAGERHDPACLLVGDCNLTAEGARAGISRTQPCRMDKASEVWTVMETEAKLGGDICIAKGCALDPFPVPVGHSFRERGMRNDCHDAVGVVVTLPLVKSMVAMGPGRAVMGPPIQVDLAHADEPAEPPREVCSPKSDSCAVEPADKQATHGEVGGSWNASPSRVYHRSASADTNTEESLEAIPLTTPTYKCASDDMNTKEEPQRGMPTGPNSCAVEPAAKPDTLGEAGGCGNAHSRGVYETVLRYFEKRNEMEGLAATDVQLEKLGRLLFSKRKVGFGSDMWVSGAIAARIIKARQAYADYCDMPMPLVTKATLENSHHGLQGWINWANPEALPEAPEVIVTVVSKEESIRRIHRVLTDRWAWLKEHNLPDDRDMTNEQRLAFHESALRAFAMEPEELQRSQAQRDSGKNQRMVWQTVRSRFSLEKQRRAGSSQMWELLSYRGRISEEMVSGIFEALDARRREGPYADPGQRDPVERGRTQKAKDELRFAKSLQRRITDKTLDWRQCNPYERYLLRKLANGALRMTANESVLALGRGRLHSAEGDYLDIGTNQEFSVVARALDGPQPQPCVERFRR